MNSPTGPAIAALLAALAFGVAFYGWLFAMALIARRIYDVLPLRRSMPLRSGVLVVQLPLYGVPGIVGALVLAAVAAPIAIPFGATLRGIGYGIALGIGFMAACSSLAQGVAAVAFAPAFGSIESASRASSRNLGSTGWMRGYHIAMKSFPILGFGLSFIAISGEELAFRGVILPLLASALGDVAAIALSTAAFVAFQTINMPSLRVAAIPMSGALVIGLTNSLLAIRGHALFPLIIAHFVFFVLLTFAVPAVLSRAGQREAVMTA